MPKSRMTSARAVTAFIAVIVGALGGCSDDSPSGARETTASTPATTSTPTSAPTGTATPTPSHPYTADQLRAAMPADDDLPAAYEMEQASVCPGDEGCPSTSATANANVLVQHTERDDDWYSLGVTEYPDAETAAQQAAASRDARSEENGTFDIPLEDDGDTYRPGRQGEGTLVDADVDGWSGYRLLSTYHAVYRDGVADTPVTEGHILLTRDGTMLSAQITISGEDTGAVSERLDEYARSIIDRLP